MAKNKYKVKAGHKFGLIGSGTEVNLTEEEAAPHLKHLDLVGKSSDFQNTSNVVIAPEAKLLTSEDKPNYASLTVPQLREELESRGLETAGVKSELVERLEEDDEE